MGTVALDISVLHSTSRQRGIGRYVYDLARGLASLEAASPTVVGLELHDFRGHATFHSGLAAAAEALRNGEGPMLSHGRWAYRQRFGLARAVSREKDVGLVHTGHPEATPLPLDGAAGPRPTLPSGKHLPRPHPLSVPQRSMRAYVTATGLGAASSTVGATVHTDHIIAVSQASADDLMRLADIPAARISVVHNGVDISSWSAEPAPGDSVLRRQVVGNDEPYLFYVGAADWRKNTVGMLAALARRPSATRLRTIVAGVGRHVGRTLDRPDQSGRRRLWGSAMRSSWWAMSTTQHWLRSTAAPVRSCSCHARKALATRWVEAMACGCPVIASDQSSTFEIAEGRCHHRAA